MAMKLPKISSVRPTKTWIVLGVAVCIGILSALAARSYLSNRLAEIDARANGKTVSIVVAKRELRKGERLSTDNVSVRPIPLDYAHSQAIAPDNFDRIDGQALAYPVKAGEMILWGLLENKRTATFSVRVTPGHRAMTVPVDEINSISGLLEPGDAIDLMASVRKDDKEFVFPLLQNVVVMATGQRSTDDPKNGEKRLYSTVTLDTSPQQALDIIRARAAGKLTALLRNPEDKAALSKTLGDAGDFFSAAQHAPGPAESREIPILVGGRSASFPAAALHLGRKGKATDTPPPPPEASSPVVKTSPSSNNLQGTAQ